MPFPFLVFCLRFGQNRQSYSQLLKEPMEPLAVKGKGKGETTLVSKDKNLEAIVVKEGTSNAHGLYKSFCTRFVRLNGILFTRTSLETFAEVLALASSGFCELLSSGPEEMLNFGADASENGLFIIRLISILIFSIHNAKREAEGQTYAEIVQRAVLLQNAFTAVFEFMGHILQSCVQLHDPSSSYLLPGILVFVEWLACCPDIASGSDADEKQTSVRSKFWNCCISFLNKILSSCSMFLDDNEDETCFYNMNRYEEGETDNRLALWEDFELRGFSPLLPAQSILDFSRKCSFGGDGSKEKASRIKRILAAGKALVNMVRVDQKTIGFNSKMKKFVIGAEPEISDGNFSTLDSSLAKSNGALEDIHPEKTMNVGALHRSPQLCMEGEEEDEVILFKPTTNEKQPDAVNPKWAAYRGLRSNQVASTGDLQFCGSSVSAPLGNFGQHTIADPIPQVSSSAGTILPRHLLQMQPHASKWLAEDAAALANSLKGVRFTENGHVMDREIHRDLGIAPRAMHHVPIQQTVDVSTSSIFCDQPKVSDTAIPSQFDVACPGSITESLAVKTPAGLPSAIRKNPVSRPVRHLGPPPGFSPVHPKQANEAVSGSDLLSDNPLDDYSWLDGYQLPSSTKGSLLNSSTNFASHIAPQYVNSNNGLSGTVSFPFPGKQVPPVQFPVEKQNGWQNYQALEHLRVQEEQHLQQQQLMNGNQQITALPEQYPGQSLWGGHYIV
uniref:DNA/RNA-binding domain-containing protein n=2 Tax=Rhizophora mucronata TaxID=61149 RepID=A0A2P2LEV0_RHIMU